MIAKNRFSFIFKFKIVFVLTATLLMGAGKVCAQGDCLGDCPGDFENTCGIDRQVVWESYTPDARQTGTCGNDNLTQWDKRVREGCGGDDRMYSYGPNDVDYYMFGDAGNDMLYKSSPGFLWLFGGEGNDTLQGASETDFLCGGPGDDWIWPTNYDTVYGNSGNDTFVGEYAPFAKNVPMDGGPGEDRILSARTTNLISRSITCPSFPLQMGSFGPENNIEVIEDYCGGTGIGSTRDGLSSVWNQEWNFCRTRLVDIPVADMDWGSDILWTATDHGGKMTKYSGGSKRSGDYDVVNILLTPDQLEDVISNSTCVEHLVDYLANPMSIRFNQYSECPTLNFWIEGDFHEASLCLLSGTTETSCDMADITKCFLHTASIMLGANGDDTLVGSNEAELFLAFAGDDVVVPSLGVDCIYGGAGDDEIRGEHAALDHNGGSDFIDGGPGWDKIVSARLNSRGDIISEPRFRLHLSDFGPETSIEEIQEIYIENKPWLGIKGQTADNPSSSQTWDFCGTQLTNVPKADLADNDDEVTTSTYHVDACTKYSGGSGNDTINILLTASQLYDAMDNAVCWNDLKAYVDTPTGNTLDLCRCFTGDEGFKAKNFESATLKLLTGTWEGACLKFDLTDQLLACSDDPPSLTIRAPDGTLVKVSDIDGNPVASIDNVGSDKQHTFNGLPIGLYDVHLQQGAATKTVSNVLVCGAKILDQLVQWTVFAPNGTAAQVRVPGTSGVVTSIGDVETDNKHVFDVVPNMYDLYLKQGAGEKTAASLDANADRTDYVLCHLTVLAPNGTAAQVRVPGTSGVVTSIGDVGTDNKHVFDVVSNIYDLYLRQGAGENTVDNVDCNGETQSVDELVNWTVWAPNNTALKVYTQDRSGLVTSIGNVGTDKNHVFDVLPNTYDLYLTQGAQETWVDNVDVSSDNSSDQLCRLTVNAPNDTSVKVYVVDTTNVVTSFGNVGVDKKHFFDVVKNTYDVYATVSPPQTAEDLDCTGETQSVTFPLP